MDTPKNKMPAKRPRSENWLMEDKRLLTELVKERVNAIENKNTDTNTNAKKIAAWTDLCSSFNTMSSGSPRTLAQLKAQWGMIKMAKKKEKAFQRKQLFMTGGGPPPPANDADNDDINSWLPHEFTVDTNVYDSDQINHIKVWGPTSPKKNKVDLTTNNDKMIQVLGEFSDTHGLPNIKSNDQPLRLNPLQENITVQSVVEDLTEEIEVVIQEQNTPKVIFDSKAAKPSGARRKFSKTPVNKKDTENKTFYMANIAETEINCRKELHSLQMEIEKKRDTNVDLEKVLLLKKIEYYEKLISACPFGKQA